MRVVALSGGYSRDEANRRLAQNTGIIASFSRALTEGLSADQTDAEFNATHRRDDRQHPRRFGRRLMPAGVRSPGRPLSPVARGSAAVSIPVDRPR